MQINKIALLAKNAVSQKDALKQLREEFADNEGIRGVIFEFLNGRDFFGVIKDNEEEAYLIAMLTLLLIVCPNRQDVTRMKKDVLRKFIQKYEISKGSM